jgi:NADPH2:quinone reductase
MTIPKTMRFVEVAEPGGPEVLRVGERPVPACGDADVLIKVAGTGMNGADLTIRRNKPSPPKGFSDISGLECAGTVVAVGKDVSDIAEGDEVCALTHQGGHAEYVVVPAPLVMPVPKGVPLAAAGAIPETFVTVWNNLVERGQLKQGETALIQGGTSGVGYTGIQIAKHYGCQVIATARTEAKCEAMRAFGADRAINYTSEDFEQVAAEFTVGKGVDVILDIVGGPYIPKELNALALDGRLVFVNLRLGKVVEADFGNIHAKRLVVTGSRLRPIPLAEKGRMCRDMVAKLWPAFEDGSLKLHICARFPFSRAAEAHALMEASDHIGKVLLYPDP